ncbi:MAG: nucleoside monophosphate kinase [Candidatus Doudnabacteria bacterium]|nr:nucleoside monophosphate kinase [Candidatus Doudnabacteria bacterium]
MKKRLGFDLILLGDTASGKDTHALLLAKKYNVRLARTGEYLRKLKGYKYRHGQPAPSNLVIHFLNHSLKHLGWHRNVIFVGAARLRHEAEYLVRQLKKRQRDFFVVYLKLPKKEIIKRSKRRAERLEDVELKLINSRIAYYKNKVSGTVRFYKKLKKIKFAKANQSINKVHSDIEKVLHDYKRSRRD